MKPSTKAELALSGMFELAGCVPSKPMALALLADKQSISLSYLEQVFASLRKHGLVLSVRGPGGGYLLARPANKISTGEIIAALDDSTIGSDNLNNSRMPSDGGLNQFWNVMNEQVLCLFKQVSLQDLLDGKFYQASSGAESRPQAAE